MPQYIDKDALVADIDKIKEMYCYDQKTNASFVAEAVINSVNNAINSLEVKEVDLEKEIRDFIKLYHLHIKDGGRIVFENNDSPNFMCDMRSIAKHFFELGMRNTITEEDCKLIWNIGDEIPNMPEEEFFKELLKQYKAQKGE